MTLKKGDKAPDFTLFNTEKNPVSLADYKGKNLIVHFFPLAFTGVCTKQLCTVRDAISMYKNDKADVIAISKKDPNGLSYGTSGAGGTPHIAGELLKQKTGANLLHIPYKGGGQALTDLLGGNIPLVYTAVAGANQYVKSGRVKAIAVSSAKRSPSLPDVPTFIEGGVKDFEINSWVGLLAPAKTPKPIIAKLNQALNEILNSPEGRDKLLAMGIVPAPGTPEKFAEQIKGDLIRIAPIVKAAQIKPE